MNRYQKQNEYFKKSVALASMQFIHTTVEVGKRNKEMRDEFYNKAQYFKNINKAIERLRKYDRDAIRDN